MLTVLLIVLLLTSSPLAAFAAYPSPGTQGINDLFMAFVGYVVGSDGSQHYQYWTTSDLLPIITHINRSTNKADGEMFTDYLFMARAIKNSSGTIKYIERNTSAPGNYTDWLTYKNELFASGKNINALYTDSLYNGLNRQIATDVWIGLPYPNPSIFTTDSSRISNVKNWIDSFISAWNAGNYSTRLTLRGFYWIQESEYYNSSSFDDGYVMQQVNSYIRTKYVNSRQLKALWIPYQNATGWQNWSSYGFDISILQPHYYFDPTYSLKKGAADAYVNKQGVEMELDLAVTWSDPMRARFIEYMNAGATGGYDSSNRYFGPYMTTAPVGWYAGGWYWSGSTRSHAINKLYSTGDKLYDKIWEFVKGTYVAGTAS